MGRGCDVWRETLMYGERLRCMERDCDVQRDYDVWGEIMMYGERL